MPTGGHYALIDELRKNENLPDEGLRALLRDLTAEEEKYLYQTAAAVRQENYGQDVYMRGLIEFTNYCRNDCYYCGIRRSNRCADRMMQRWKELDHLLLTKYIDGNIKRTTPDGRIKTTETGVVLPPQQPPYPAWFYEQIVNDHGDVLLAH
jgi:hypothetical protein